jgi:hypothetical protein
MTRRSVWVLASVLVGLGIATGFAGGPRPDSETVLRRLEEIKQPPELNRWQQIPWVLDLKEALHIARQEKRPLLLWVSGDDPLERC